MVSLIQKIKVKKIEINYIFCGINLVELPGLFINLVCIYKSSVQLKTDLMLATSICFTFRCSLKRVLFSSKDCNKSV